jgi:hypothetical protein
MTDAEFEELRIGDLVHWPARRLNGTAIDIIHGFFDKAILIKSGDAFVWASYRNVLKGEKDYERKRRTYRKKNRASEWRS